MDERNIVPLNPLQRSMADFMEEVAAEAFQFRAIRAFVVLINENDDSTSLRHELRVADAALIACDCLGTVIGVRGGDEV